MKANEQIIKARKAQGYTQEALASNTNLSLRTIQRIEKGKGSPRAHTLKVLSDFLGIALLDNEASTQQGISEAEHNTILLMTYATITVAFLPLVNCFIPLSIWLKNQDSKSINAFGRKVVHFQVLWLGALLTCCFLLPLITYSLTGQVAIGKFPLFALVYFLFISINVISTMRLSSSTIQAYQTARIAAYH